MEGRHRERERERERARENRSVRGVGGVFVVGEEKLAQVFRLVDADGLDNQLVITAHEQEAAALALEAQFLDLPA
jgi:hypothetical protein